MIGDQSDFGNRGYGLESWSKSIWIQNYERLSLCQQLFGTVYDLVDMSTEA